VGAYTRTGGVARYAREWEERRTRRQAPGFFADGVCLRVRRSSHAPAV